MSKLAEKVFDVKTIYRWREEGIFREVIQVKDGYLIPEKEVLRVIEERTRRACF